MTKEERFTVAGLAVLVVLAVALMTAKHYLDWGVLHTERPRGDPCSIGDPTCDPRAMP